MLHNIAIIHNELNDIPEENHILPVNNNQGNDDDTMDGLQKVIVKYE